MLFVLFEAKFPGLPSILNLSPSTHYGRSYVDYSQDTKVKHKHPFKHNNNMYFIIGPPLLNTL